MIENGVQCLSDFANNDLNNDLKPHFFYAACSWNEELILELIQIFVEKMKKFAMCRNKKILL